MRHIVYYCPRCDRTISKKRIEEADRELRARFGVSRLSALRCPVCDTEYIDMDEVRKGGERYVGQTRKKTSAR